MKFTEYLYENTKASHLQVDKHDFVKAIRHNTKAAELYIHLNQICILNIQNIYDIKQIHPSLERNINSSHLENFHVDSEHLKTLLKRCGEFPIEHAYMFYLGLLFGGNMLLKMFRDRQYDSFFTFTNPKELITIFKDYLDNTIVDENCQQTFVNRVNESYNIIKEIFDELLVAVS